jgi:hypothetical protein
MSIYDRISCVLEQFTPASQQDIDRLKLQNRVDQKFIFKIGELESILNEVKECYNIMSVNALRLFQYNTLYFDTTAFASYTDHHNGKPNRYKLRYRRYQDSGDVFFEIKKKIKGLRTDKHRIAIEEIPEILGPSERQLLQDCNLPDVSLLPTMWVNYQRMTLLSRNTEERVTIDLHLEFQNNQNKDSLDGLVIVEIKQAKASRNSPFMECLRQRQIRETRISKYSIGIALLNEHMKQNAFGSKLRKIRHLIDEQWNQAS